MTDSRSQSVSMSLSGLISRALRIICEYYLTTSNAVWSFIHPCTCQMGSSIFAAMIWLNFVTTTRVYLPSIPLTEIKTEKNVSVDCGRSYLAYPSWLFQTKLVEPPLAHICRNPRQRCQVWRQWWIQPDDPINLGSWHHPESPCPCHSPDVYTYMIWYVTGGLGVWHVLMLRWSPVGKDKGFDHTLCCNSRWPGLLFCR